MRPATLDFIIKYVKELRENNAVVFVGAGLSTDVGYFDWKKLLEPVATKLGLDIADEHDLTALAQHFVDLNRGRGELTQVLVDHYHNFRPSLSEKHRILARLPIQIYWTTNFDNLIEESLIEAGRTPDIKKGIKDLSINLPRRDAIVYKMHGDISNAADTVLTKHEYEDFHKNRELFGNAFKSDFVARTFLFIGFSFTDPNLDFLIARIRSTLGENKKPDYYFIKKDEDPKSQRRIEIKAESLKLYGLHPVWIDSYSEIEDILREIEIRYLRSSIFISGSAQTYDPFRKEEAELFLHHLSYLLSKQNYKIVTGFGLGVGSFVINGVLHNMGEKRNQDLNSYIVMCPFPQATTSDREIKQIWKEYRDNFMALAGIAVFVFGNKDGGNELAYGMEEEFEIASKIGLKVIPVGATGYMAEKLWQKLMNNFESHYPDHLELKPLFAELGNDSLPLTEIANKVLTIIEKLNFK